jgi:LAO/AO transport system kinase
MSHDTSVVQLAKDLVGGDRRALAQALSLVESTADDDQPRIVELLTALPPSKETTRRIGVTGSPGVGKSTFLETFGLSLLEAGHRLAVLAVDPTSRRSGGSILGDKVRMQKLSLDDRAFVRPSPSRLALGGAAFATRDAITVCEAAGFTTTIVETVGVGQSEIETFDMVDLFLVLVLSQAGDDLQGIKRGVMEVADAVIVTKSDLSPDAASQARAMYRATMRLLSPSRPGWESPVLTVSALKNEGLTDVVNVVNAFFQEDREALIDAVRRNQRMSWFEELVRRKIAVQSESDAALAARLAVLRDKVAKDSVPVTSAVHDFLSHLTISFTERS